MHTQYARRITLAVAVSVLAHAAFFLAVAVLPQSPPVEASAAKPLSVRLEPPPVEPEPPAEIDTARRLVDAVAEDAPPERPTDLIAEADSRARDLSELLGEDLMPSVDVLDEYERIAALPPPPQPEPPAPAFETLEPIEPEREEAAEVEESASTAPEEPLEAVTEEPRATPAERREVAQARPDTPEAQPRQDNPILRDQRPAETPAPPDVPSPSRGRMQGAVMSKGFLGFEAMQDDIAPYLRHVQDRVERRWRLSMELEYRGAARARAIVDCAIKPDGELAFVRIHDDGGNPGYAAACADAIRRAAPFGAFPFEVPALYRDEEIVIRWTFQFM